MPSKTQNNINIKLLNKIKMKTIKFFAALLIIPVIILTGCSKQENKISNTSENQTVQSDTSRITESETPQENQGQMKTEKGANIVHKMINVPTVQCDNCKANLTKVLKNVKGVKSFEIDIDKKIIHLNFDNSQTDINKIDYAIASAGYDADRKKANPEAYDKLDDCCKKPEDRKNK